jgi:hypothetical protein
VVSSPPLSPPRLDLSPSVLSYAWFLVWSTRTLGSRVMLGFPDLPKLHDKLHAYFSPPF